MAKPRSITAFDEKECNFKKLTYIKELIKIILKRMVVTLSLTLSQNFLS